jgi:dCTP deaminase
MGCEPGPRSTALLARPAHRSRLRSPVVLSDHTIKEEIEAGRIVVSPYDPGLIQPSSIDVRVDSKFRVFHNARYPYIDVRKSMEDLTELVEISDSEPFVLHPGEFVLGQTLESITLPGDIVARLEGKSSLGRLGLLIHSTAGFVDPSFKGNLTLELSNVANLPITIYYGMPIGQISFMRMDRPVDQPYGASGIGSKYQGQREPTPSRFYRNFE